MSILDTISRAVGLDTPIARAHAYRDGVAAYVTREARSYGCTSMSAREFPGGLKIDKALAADVVTTLPRAGAGDGQDPNGTDYDYGSPAYLWVRLTPAQHGKSSRDDMWLVVPDGGFDAPDLTYAR